MIINPLSYAARVAVLFFVKRISPAAIVSVVTSVVTAVFSLLTTVGFSRTLQIILRLRRAVNLKAVPSVLKDILFKGTNPIAADTIFRIVSPDWARLIRNLIPINKILNILVFVFCSILFFKPLVSWLIRFTLTVLGSAVGILYMPTLKGIKWLKDYSLLVLSFAPFTMLPPFVQDLITENTKPRWDWLTYGLIAVAVVALILGLDNYYPKTPGIEGLSGLINVVWRWAYEATQITGYTLGAWSYAMSIHTLRAIRNIFINTGNAIYAPFLLLFNTVSETFLGGVYQGFEQRAVDIGN